MGILFGRTGHRLGDHVFLLDDKTLEIAGNHIDDVRSSVHFLPLGRQLLPPTPFVLLEVL